MLLYCFLIVRGTEVKGSDQMAHRWWSIPNDENDDDDDDHEQGGRKYFGIACI